MSFFKYEHKTTTMCFFHQVGSAIWIKWYLLTILQFFFAKEVIIKMNGTTKSSLFLWEEDWFFEINLEWLIQRLETTSEVVLTAAALRIVILPPRTLTSIRNYWHGFILWEAKVASWKLDRRQQKTHAKTQHARNQRSFYRNAQSLGFQLSENWHGFTWNKHTRGQTHILSELCKSLGIG